MKLSNLTPNKHNPRKITEEKLEMIKKSLIEFGDLSGIVFNRKTNRLVGGHQRLKVLPSDSEIIINERFDPITRTGTIAKGTIVIDGEPFIYREVLWDEAKEKAANIAANKHGGEWDLPKLSEWMLELDHLNYPLDLTGFDEKELSDLLAPIHNGQYQCDEDEVPEITEEPKTTLGDIYQLGNHRLMCGDSTSVEAVEKLMNGEKADMCFTSPPYNLGDSARLRRDYNGKRKDSVYLDKSDHKTDGEYLEFLLSFTNNALLFSDTAFINIQCLAGNKFVIPEYWYKNSSRLIDIMIWDKEHAAPATAERVLNSVWDFIFIFGNYNHPTRVMKHGPNFRGTIDNIYRLNPVGKKDPLAKDHGAVFPVQFVENFVSNFSDHNVLDLFGGSGTTLIACEKTNRRCFMSEISPYYIDVIIQRWIKFTGKMAYLIEDSIDRPMKEPVPYMEIYPFRKP